MKDVLKEIIPRKYQEGIYKTALEKNTLVVLPTGLGKTLIALMVTIERIKKFPRERVLILAPTKPLIEQHMESFKKSLPELWADLELFTGAIKPEKRKELWRVGEIIFSTPQCIANDLKKGLYNLKEVSLLIEDEAHRCTKNYDYTYIAKRYLKEARNPRLMGLTASPGAEQKKILEICKNLGIEEVEARTRESLDVKDYLQELSFEKIEVKLPESMIEISNLLKKIYERFIEELKSRKVLYGNTSKTALIELQKRLGILAKTTKNPNNFAALSVCAQAIKLSHAIELLETQSLEGFNQYLKDLYSQAAKKQSKGVIRLTRKKEFNEAYAKTLDLLEKGEEHPKIKEIIKIIREQKKLNQKTKAIIFSQFRETSKIISRNLNKLNDISSSVFVGQKKVKGQGLNQKEQKKLIDDFKSGEKNVLCSTSIGEEGLDIPEVDLVIFYEPISSAVRTIQRRGRTARLSKGNLIILMTKKTKDEISYYASRRREKKMSESLEKIKEELNENGKIKTSSSKQKKLF